MWVIALLAAVTVVGVWLVASYNRLVRLRNRSENAWAQVDVQLRRRADLVPNLVETVKGYATHERETLEAVVSARNAALAAGGLREKAEAEGLLTGALRRLFALAEAYPELRASESFRTLQGELAEAEDKIAVARQIYNDAVLTYDNALETLPTRLVARAFGFTARPYFEVDGAYRNVPEVGF